MQEIIITQPDDWHLHVREGLATRHVVADSCRQFGRAMIMPNLKPPVTTVAAALDYRQHILSALPEGSDFSPLMALYLTDQTTASEVRRVAETDGVMAFKLYPAGATTNSDAGIRELDGLNALLEVMEAQDVPLLVHGEVADTAADIFDREEIFIDRYLAPLTRRFTALRVVLEHVTTRQGVDFVRESRSGVAATITAHHLLFNRNALLAGGIRPHYYCLPILKREQDRLALLDAATSGNPRFFLGTDSAPHARNLKESACGCAGCYTAHAAMELYATAFEAAGKLDRLEGFASLHGADFYGLPHNTRTLTLVKSTWQIPEAMPFGDGIITPLMAGESLGWQVRVS